MEDELSKNDPMSRRRYKLGWIIDNISSRHAMVSMLKEKMGGRVSLDQMSMQNLRKIIDDFGMIVSLPNAMDPGHGCSSLTHITNYLKDDVLQEVYKKNPPVVKDQEM